MNEAQAIADYCNNRFVGWTMYNFGTTEDGYVAFTLTKGEQKRIAYLLSDPEGNGVGFIEEGEYIKC